MALTDLQKQGRQSGLFSSDIARIMTGQSVAVALEKLGHISDDWEHLSELDEIQLGELTEPYILQAYQDKYGVELERSPELTHPQYEWMGSHPDSIVKPSKRVIVEAKTVGTYNISEWGNPGTDQVNFYTLWQSVVHMACGDADRVDVVVCYMTLEATKYLLLKKSPPIHVFHIHRDFEAEDLMLKKARFVHDCIEAGVTPPPETLDDARLIWSKAQNIEVEASEEIVKIYNQLMKARREVKEAEKTRDGLALQIQVYMNNAATLKFDNQTLVTWKNDAPGVSFNRKKFAEENEQLYKNYLEPTEGSRRLLPKTLK